LCHGLRLLERLDAGTRGKLTVVSAPAGYGKTTLVSEWIHSVGVHGADGVRAHGRAPVHVAWLSLDASDNDVGGFFSYLIAALQQID
jgi:LuxR family maltose regulon positive regulatory protein